MIGDDAATTPAHLLIVDDDIGTIRLLSTILKGEGDVFFATRGADALVLARRHRPDVILLDAAMPDMDGFALCEAVKSDPALADCSVIFITSHADHAHEMRALELGAVDFISKPISPPVVRARVRAHVTLKRQTDLLRQAAATDGLTGIRQPPNLR